MATAKARNGSYSVRVNLTDTVTGKRTQRRLTARTKRELDAAVAQLKASWHNGTYVEPATQKLSDYMTAWLDTVKRAESTQLQYGVVARRHILSDDIAAIPLGRLKRAHVQQFVDRKNAAGFSAAYVRQMHVVLSAALSRAADTGIIAANPASGVELPRLSRGVPHVWSATEARSFLDGVAAEDDAALWYLAVTLGLRRGELIGLRWPDIDLTRGVLTIQRTQTRTKTGKWIIGDVAKTTAGHRTIQLPAVCRDALKRYRTRQLERRLQWGEAWIGTDAVFDRGDGAHINTPATLTARFTRLVASLDLPAIKFHGTRHTAASVMLQQGIPVHVVSRILGHASPAVTLNTYAWVLADMQETAAARIDALFA